jgi:hypothetical protein
MELARDHEHEVEGAIEAGDDERVAVVVVVVEGALRHL